MRLPRSLANLSSGGNWRTCRRGATGGLTRDLEPPRVLYLPVAGRRDGNWGCEWFHARSHNRRVEEANLGACDGLANRVHASVRDLGTDTCRRLRHHREHAQTHCAREEEDREDSHCVSWIVVTRWPDAQVPMDARREGHQGRNQAKVQVDEGQLGPPHQRPGDRDEGRLQLGVESVRPHKEDHAVSRHTDRWGFERLMAIRHSREGTVGIRAPGRDERPPK